MMESIVRDCGSSGRTYKSALIFAAPDATTNVRDATRNALAWEDIDDDEDTKKRMDESQLEAAHAEPGGCAAAAQGRPVPRVSALVLARQEQRSAAHRPGPDHVERDHAQRRHRGAEPPGAATQRRNHRGREPWQAGQVLAPGIDGVVDGRVRDAFYSSPQLPRLLNPDIIKRTICDGVTQGAFGYATKDSRGNLKLQKLKESLFDTEVETIRGRVHPEGRRRPEAAGTAPTGAVDHSAGTGDDQGRRAGGVFAVVAGSVQPAVLAPAVKWSAKGGTVTAEGVFTAGDTGGVYSVHAQGGGLEAIAEVRIMTKDDPPPPPPPPGKRTVSWRGTVPPQKWMNFYTKVLTPLRRPAGSRSSPFPSKSPSNPTRPTPRPTRPGAA